jgi:hypothetical protein
VTDSVIRLCCAHPGFPARNRTPDTTGKPVCLGGFQASLAHRRPEPSQRARPWERGRPARIFSLRRGIVYVGDPCVGSPHQQAIKHESARYGQALAWERRPSERPKTVPKSRMWHHMATLLEPVRALHRQCFPSLREPHPSRSADPPRRTPGAELDGGSSSSPRHRPTPSGAANAGCSSILADSPEFGAHRGVLNLVLSWQQFSPAAARPLLTTTWLRARRGRCTAGPAAGCAPHDPWSR